MSENQLPSVGKNSEFVEKCINTIRFLSVDAVQKANSGHPGMPMEASDLAYALWTRFLKYNPKNPVWPNRDRFILSAGHGSMLLYSMLHLTGYDLSLDEIRNFRQWGSRTPGHPEYGLTPGVETTTGPLGQGFATGVGVAMAQRYLANMFNRPGFPVVDYDVVALVSDGDLMEGVANEAASLAGHLGLGRMIYIYLDNRITIEGSTEVSFTDDTEKRFQALNWHVQRIDGRDQAGMDAAVAAAKAETSRPSLIVARTIIGCGSPNKAGTAECHGSPLGEEETRLTKECCLWPDQPPFHVPEDALAFFRQAVERGRSAEASWQSLFEAYRKEYPELARQWDEMRDPAATLRGVRAWPVFDPAAGSVATRSASGKVLNAIKPQLPGLLGGSADLAPSNNTHLKGFGEFKKEAGPNIHFGVREHAMGSALNGLALSGFLKPYGGTFLVFADYMRPSVRLAALMDLPVVYVFTHDSIGLGEDGPTHQPVEHLASLRVIPNLNVIRPSDANETVEAWKAALSRTDGPTALILTRQNLPVIDRSKFGPAEGLHKGAYILAEAPDGRPDAILIGSGSEVHLLLDAREKLAARGTKARVVAMPSLELFEAQDRAYRDLVLPPDVTARLTVEAGRSFGWDRFVGPKGDILGIDRFGASAPAKALFEKFGFTVDEVLRRVDRILTGR